MRRRRHWGTALACTAVFLAIADGLGVVVALRAIAESFHTSAGALRWVVGAALAASALGLPLGAQSADRHGPRRALAAAWGLFTAASAACAVVPNVGWLIAARAAQGTGAAMAVSSSRRLAEASEPEGAKSRPAWRAVVAAAMASGPLLVAAWVSGPGWRWYFGFDAVVGALGLGATLAQAREPRCQCRRTDVEGLLSAAVGVTAVVWALSRVGAVGWSAPSVLVALGIGLVAVALVVRWMMPMGPRHRRGFLASNTAELFFFASVSGPVYAVSRDMQSAYAFGSFGTGMRLTIWTAVTAWPLAFRPPVRGAVFPRARRVVGITMHGVGLVGLAWTAGEGMQRPVALAPLAISGAGVGLALGAMRGTSASQSRPGKPGPAIVVVGAVSLVGAALGLMFPSAVFPVLGAATVGARHAAVVSVLRWAAVLAAVAAAASLAVPTRSPGLRPVPAADPPGPACPRDDGGGKCGPSGQASVTPKPSAWAASHLKPVESPIPRGMPPEPFEPPVRPRLTLVPPSD